MTAYLIYAIWLYFNPHPRVEGDRRKGKHNNRRSYFNPHPRVEGDKTFRDSGIYDKDFNPHPRVEGDDIQA